MSLIASLSNDPDVVWCEKHKPQSGSLDAHKVYLEAQNLSEYKHLAAFFGVTEEEIASYKSIIERGRLVAEHEYLRRLRLLMENQDKDAIKLYAEMLKIFNLDKTAPITKDDQMTDEKVLDIFKRK